MPLLALLVRKLLPRQPDDLRQRAVARLHAARDALAPDKGRAEEDERVRRARDVVRGFSLPGSARFEIVKV
jgi:hypothetical protein